MLEERKIKFGMDGWRAVIVKLFNNYRNPLFSGKLSDPSMENLVILKDFVKTNINKLAN